MYTAEEIKSLFGLVPLPEEGGYYRETYRADEKIPATALPARYKSRDRAYSTLIYYLLTPDTFSAMHRILSDEIFHFYLGDSVEMLQLLPGGSGKIITIGQDIKNGEVLQCVVPKGVWQGSRLKAGGAWALLGVTVTPGFEFVDYENAKREELLQSHPDFEDLIIALTRQ